LEDAIEKLAQENQFLKNSINKVISPEQEEGSENTSHLIVQNRTIGQIFGSEMQYLD
jgi:hypothetical protein